MSGSTCLSVSHRGPAFEIAAEEAIRRHAEIEGGLRGVFDDGRPMFLGERQHTEDAVHTGFPFMTVDVIADGVDRWPECAGRPQASPPSSAACVAAGRRRRCGASPAARAHARAAAARSSGRADGQRGRSTARRHDDRSSQAVSRSTRRRPRHSHRGAPADTEAVIAKRFERERAERRLLLSKHRGDLALRGAMNARVGPVGFPAIEIRLRLIERLEAEPA